MNRDTPHRFMPDDRPLPRCRECGELRDGVPHKLWLQDLEIKELKIRIAKLEKP